MSLAKIAEKAWELSLAMAVVKSAGRVLTKHPLLQFASTLAKALDEVSEISHAIDFAKIPEKA